MSTLFVLLVSLLFLLPRPVYADYVLPYPSYMPGNKIYTISRIIDLIKKPLYFGNISSYKYHLSLADKYLVEAKTLFEYKQYLLAVDALERSDKEFSKVPMALKTARKEGKDVRTFLSIYGEAAEEHKNVLMRLMGGLPESFEWSPEKTESTTLLLKDLIKTSIVLREARVMMK